MNETRKKLLELNRKSNTDFIRRKLKELATVEDTTSLKETLGLIMDKIDRLEEQFGLMYEQMEVDIKNLHNYKADK